MEFFGYEELLQEARHYRGKGRMKPIGTSLFGRYILAVIPEKRPTVIIHGGIHAREHITSKLVFEMAKAYEGDRVMFIPMVNPDGVELCVRGVTTAPEGHRKHLLKVNGGKDFSRWKGNGRAVDLNVNFPADWGLGAGNCTRPNAEGGFVGMFPFSERESKVMREVTMKYDPSVTVSYHCKGELVYYGFKDFPDYPEEVQLFADATGYATERTPESRGGYKDWFVSGTSRPAVTIEVGSDEYGYPFPYTELDKILAQNAKVPQIAEEIAQRVTRHKPNYDDGFRPLGEIIRPR